MFQTISSTDASKIAVKSAALPSVDKIQKYIFVYAPMCCCTYVCNM
jgi:hypothetical protein